MVGLNPVLRAMDVALQLWIAQIAQGIDAANQLVELEDGPPRGIWLGISAQLADQRALGHLLETQRGDDLVEVGFLVRDGLPVDLADGANQAWVRIL